MAYCGPRGIPLHEFLDWPALSRDAALAWQERENAKCRCGQVRSEWRKYDEHGHPVLENGAHVADPDNAPFTVDGEFCPACHALEQAEKTAPKVDGTASRAWVLGFVPNPDYVAPWDKPLQAEAAEAG